MPARAHSARPPVQVAINGERPWVDPETPEPLKKLINKCWHQDPHVSEPGPVD